MRIALALGLLLVASACSSSPQDTVPAGDCTYSTQHFQYAFAPDGGVGGAVVDDASAYGDYGRPSCWNFSASPSDDAGGVSCALLVVVSNATDEAACAPFGFDVPSPGLVSGAQSAFGTTSAICLVPQRTPPPDAGCQYATTPEWCVASDSWARSGGCTQTTEISWSVWRQGFDYYLQCAQGC